LAYPTNSLSLVLEDVDRRCVDLKALCVRRKADLAGSDQPSTLILDLFTRLRQDRNTLAAAAATSGIGPYAQAQKGDANLDVAAAFNGLLSAIDSVTGWITANFPKDVNGFLLAKTLGADGPVDRVFTAAQTAGLRTALDSVIAAIS
jgi:hypothetical protein